MDHKYLKLIFEREDHRKIEMGTGCPIKLTVAPQGVEAPEYTIYTESNATTDGSTVSGKKVAERNIKVFFGIDTVLESDVYREKLVRFFNPKHTISLTAIYGYAQMKIQGEISSFNFDEQVSLWGFLTGELDILCPFPYFEDLDNFGRNIASITALFSFQLFIPKDRGRAMSYRTLKKDVHLPNSGDVPTGIEIHMIATRGAVKNPKIVKSSTGEFIELFLDLNKGDVLKINTNPGKKSITLNGKNVFKEKNKLSTFFQIDVGENLIQYDAEENYTNLDVNLYYTPKYLGV